VAKRVCPNGHVSKDKSALKCSQCGADLPPIPKRKKTGLLVLGGVALLIIIIAAANGGNKDGATPAASNPKATRVPTATPKPKPISPITFEEIREHRKNDTEAQWDEFQKPLDGLRVQWTGWVEQVEASGRILIDMDSPDAILSVQDVYIPIPKEDATKYNKDQKLTFDGEIKSVVGVMSGVSVTLENVTILP